MCTCKCNPYNIHPQVEGGSRQPPIATVFPLSGYDKVAQCVCEASKQGPTVFPDLLCLENQQLQTWDNSSDVGAYSKPSPLSQRGSSSDISLTRMIYLPEVFSLVSFFYSNMMDPSHYCLLEMGIISTGFAKERALSQNIPSGCLPKKVFIHSRICLSCKEGPDGK
jgi:hypothetical protein